MNFQFPPTLWVILFYPTNYTCIDKNLKSSISLIFCEDL